MKRISTSLLLVLLLTVFLFAQNKTQNVILITLDGVRTEEMFGGLDLDILKSVDTKWETSDAYKKYWADTPEARRAKTMPFLWGTLLKTQGSIAGDRAIKSEVKTTNKMLFSYPGYSEILTGQAHDDVIHSNDFGQNPFPSVLDFLQKKLKLHSNQVADFSSWARFNRIATNNPDSFLVNAGYEQYLTQNNEAAALSRQQFQTLTPWPDVRHDHYTFKLALAHMKDFHPRVMHIGLGETDDWAHEKKYGRVLDALNLTDGLVKELWDLVQSDPQYRDKTTIIITTDHGRGSKTDTWMNHGFPLPEAGYVWMVFISPDVKLRGEWQSTETVYQNQIAATMCKFLGVDYAEQNPEAGKPIGKLFEK
ncbi:MAG TPA: hypothetical protein VGO50_14655 [Pyrinomonadaceae bacterium]|jgi:hypothetical protein|nr:hypothetical protein [Pyrinomonadaceae bacterium]